MNFYTTIPDKKCAVKFLKAFSLLAVFILLALPLTAQKKTRGKVTTTYTNGNKKSQGKMKKGMKQGVWQYWSETGELVKTITWKNDKMNGLYTEYYPNGKKSFEGNYVEDGKSGEWNTWYTDGKLSSKLNYQAAYGKESYDGVQRYWYENGQLREQTGYENQKIVYSEKWFANGKRRVIEHYKDGLREGTWRKYPEPYEATDTLPSSVDNYVRGKKNGVHLGYTRGRLSEEFYYTNDKLDGTYKKWDTNSQLGVSENYVNGSRDGLCRYFNYGKCIREVTYEDGRINGEEKEYDGRGELFRISWYKKGTIDSAFNYHKNGRLAVSRTYNYYPGFVYTEEFSEYTEWDTAGVLLLRGTYHFEKKDKDWTTYYADGKVKSVTTWSGKKIVKYAKWYANGKKMVEMECDGYYISTAPKVWDEKGKVLKPGTKAYEEIVDSSKPGEIYNNPQRYKENRRNDDEPPAQEERISDSYLEQEGMDMEIDLAGPPPPPPVEAVRDDEVFSVAEQMPEFPGGNPAMMDFLKYNLKYPQVYRDAGREGTVYIGYIVEKDGSVTNVKELKGVPGCPEFAKEAMRVVAAFPKHTPALMNGRAVRCNMTIPVRFRLE